MMSSMQRQARDMDEIQMVTGKTGTVFPATKLHGIADLGAMRGTPDRLTNSNVHLLNDTVMPLVTLGNKAGLSISHVHPNIPESSPIFKKVLKSVEYDREYARRKGFDERTVTDELSNRLLSNKPNRLAMQSGNTSQQDTWRHMSKGERSRLFANDKDAMDMVSAYKATDQDAYELAAGRFSKADESIGYRARGARMSPMAPDDATAFANAYPNQVNPIHDVTNGIVGLHKVTTGGQTGVLPVGKRSVYLNLHPNR